MRVDTKLIQRNVEENDNSLKNLERLLVTFEEENKELKESLEKEKKAKELVIKQFVKYIKEIQKLKTEKKDLVEQLRIEKKGKEELEKEKSYQMVTLEKEKELLLFGAKEKEKESKRRIEELKKTGIDKSKEYDQRMKMLEENLKKTGKELENHKNDFISKYSIEAQSINPAYFREMNPGFLYHNFIPRFWCSDICSGNEEIDVTLEFEKNKKKLINYIALRPRIVPEKENPLKYCCFPRLIVIYVDGKVVGEYSEKIMKQNDQGYFVLGFKPIKAQKIIVRGKDHTPDCFSNKYFQLEHIYPGYDSELHN